MMATMTTGTDEDRKRLGDLIRAARQAEGLTHTEAAARSEVGGRRGIQRKAWIAVEAGRQARPLTYSAIEHALELESGACEAVLAGGSELRKRPREIRVTDVSNATDAVTTLIGSIEEIDDVRLRAVIRVVRNELQRRGVPEPPAGPDASASGSRPA